MQDVMIETDKISIGDAARILGVPTHTLRYWEKEFDFYINPARTEGGQRRYDEESLKRFEVVKSMLKNDGYSIAGARRVLSRTSNVELPAVPKAQEDSISRKELIRRLSDIIQREVLDALYVGSVRASA